MLEKLKLFGIGMLVVGLFYLGLKMATSNDPDFNWPVKLLGMGAWVYLLGKMFRGKHEEGEPFTEPAGPRLIQHYDKSFGYVILAAIVWAVLLSFF